MKNIFKKPFISLLLVITSFGMLKSQELKTSIDSISYVLGVNTSKSILMQFTDVKLDKFIQGLQDFKKSQVKVNPEDIKNKLDKYFEQKKSEQFAKQQKIIEKKYTKVKTDGIAFLEKNKKQKGVKVTSTGLQYIVIKEGTGRKPKATSEVEVHYHGTTPDGKVFDSSVDRKQTAKFPLNRVIPGWTEGVQLMKEGAKYKFFIPQELAYGINAPQGGNGPIKPYMPLIFEVELIKVMEGTPSAK